MSRPRYSAATRNVLARAMAPEDAAVFLGANPAKSGAAVASGTEAQEHGAALERWLSAQHLTAQKSGVANIRKVGPPVVMGSGGVLVGFAGVGPADYLGLARQHDGRADELADRRQGVPELAADEPHGRYATCARVSSQILAPHFRGLSSRWIMVPAPRTSTWRALMGPFEVWIVMAAAFRAPAEQALRAMQPESFARWEK
jgi:hypothetical protein